MLDRFTLTRVEANSGGRGRSHSKGTQIHCGSISLRGRAAKDEGSRRSLWGTRRQMSRGRHGGEVGYGAEGPRRTLDRMRSRGITRDLGEFRAEGPNGTRKDTGLESRSFENWGKWS